MKRRPHASRGDAGGAARAPEGQGRPPADKAGPYRGSASDRTAGKSARRFYGPSSTFTKDSHKPVPAGARVEVVNALGAVQVSAEEPGLLQFSGSHHPPGRRSQRVTRRTHGNRLSEARAKPPAQRLRNAVSQEV